jgi:hypothetical protein
MAAPNPNESSQPAVRFSSMNQEISPDSELQDVETLTAPNHPPQQALTEEAQEELRNLSITLQKSKVQANRLAHFNFEPVSLPPSRVSHLMPHDLPAQSLDPY